MNKAAVLTFMLAIIFTVTTNAQKIETFKQAKALSIELGKPILLEFFHEG